jgi:hypothetical protein
VEVVIWLDTVEPPAGSVRRVAGTELPGRGAKAMAVEFTLG